MWDYLLKWNVSQKSDLFFYSLVFILRTGDCVNRFLITVKLYNLKEKKRYFLVINQV